MCILCTPPPGRVLGFFMKTVNFYIDGFNLYHSAFKKHPVWVNGETKRVGWPDLRWQNLRALMDQFVVPEKEIIGQIYYFSAVADWLPSKADKHHKYIEALKTQAIIPVLGKFKAKEKRCQATCKEMFTSHEEKESDVNVAIYMLSDLLLNKCETAYLVSGDSDMKPAILLAKKLCPSKRIGLIIPPYQKASDLKNSVDFFKKITKDHLKKSLLPQEVISGDKNIQAPINWLPNK